MENTGRTFSENSIRPLLPKDSKMKKGSSGIGLAICRALIEAHNGNIWVESIVGSGSKFSFTVPRWLEDESKAGFGSR